MVLSLLKPGVAMVTERRIRFLKAIMLMRNFGDDVLNPNPSTTLMEPILLESLWSKRFPQGRWEKYEKRMGHPTYNYPLSTRIAFLGGLSQRKDEHI